MHARQLKRWSLALALAALLEGRQTSGRAGADERAPAGQARSPEPIVGEHEVRATSPHVGLELALKRGVSVRLKRLSPASQAQGAVLRVAKFRAQATEIAPELVPIGPMVELSIAEGSADVWFAADQFRLRAGHRLVLAVEQVEGAALFGQPGWQLVKASNEAGRCRAEAVQLRGRRLQFGSLPGP